MTFKFADEIVDEIKERGVIDKPVGSVSREEFEEWLRTEKKEFNELPSVTPIQKWIPCNERLPKEHICDDGYVEPSDYVLVYGDCRSWGVSRYWGNRKSKAESPNSFKDWVDLDWVAEKPIAWMPLPKPYKSEKESKE